MNSCLYECEVMHHRLKPKVNFFRYRIFMFYLDLDEVIESPLFGSSRFKPYRFCESDHLPIDEAASQGGAPTRLKEGLRAYLASHGIDFPGQGRVMLLTLPRVLGYIFNPVSFYFCGDQNGTPICAVAEVGNTFGEKKLYLLPGPNEEGRFRLTTPKYFYVSPFFRLDLQFDFKLRLPSDQLEIHIDDWDGGKPILLSALTGKRAPLTTARLAWLSFKYPWITLKVIALIHWQALVLWLKQIPFHRKAADPQLQRNVLNPHPSISSQ